MGCSHFLILRSHLILAWLSCHVNLILVLAWSWSSTGLIIVKIGSMSSLNKYFDFEICDFGTLGPLDLGTLAPWYSWTSSLLVSLPHTLLLWYGLLWGWRLIHDIGDWDWRWTFDFYVDVRKLSVGSGCCTLNYSISSGPFLSFAIAIGDGPRPELDNIFSFWRLNKLNDFMSHLRRRCL